MDCAEPITADRLFSVDRPLRPYPGLRPFEIEEWSIFFGREQIIDQVIELLASRRLVIVHGSSGSGKSSLIRAGVLPRLACEHLRYGMPWRTVTMRPSGGPLWNLATALASIQGREAPDLDRIHTIHRSFDRVDARLQSIVADILGLPGQRVCILIDQFEELFRYSREVSRDESQLFVELLARLIDGDGESEVHAVITMRSEFLGECTRYDDLADVINQTQYLLPRMDRDSLHRAICRPAELYGGAVDAELAECLIADAGGGHDELPLIQHALMILWQEALEEDGASPHLSANRYCQHEGGAAALLSDHADRVTAKAASKKTRQIELLFRALTEINSKSQGIRRPQRFDQLVAATGSDPRILSSIIDAFRAETVSFLTPYPPAPIANDTIIDISHEALIRCWRSLADPEDGWLQREFEDGLRWRSLASLTEHFVKNPREVLPSALSSEYRAWCTTLPSAWCQRYGGGWECVLELLRASRACRLTIATDRTTLTGEGFDVDGPPPSPDFDFYTLTSQLQRARDPRGARRDAAGANSAHSELESVLNQMGSQLAEAFLPEEVSKALAAEVARAAELNSTLELALDVADAFADLQWETLRLAEIGTLALHPQVDLYRRIDTGEAAAAVTIPGPLRILVAIGSPEAQNARGELLDMEAELQRILDATDAPRRARRVFVHILEQGSVATIHAALSERRYHILHISCHAAPGALILEHADGREDLVTGTRLCNEAIPAERQPPLVVLATASTSVDTSVQNEHGATKLPGLVRTLLSGGVPSVIAMQASVSDFYMTELMGVVYASLGSWEEPRPLAALSQARRQLEAKRQAETGIPRSPEWPTPVFFSSTAPRRLYDPRAPVEPIESEPEPKLDAGVIVRRVGEMVGRRRELRLTLRTLRDPNRAGVVVHGMGGVGKSTLAAEVMHRLGAAGIVLASLAGKIEVDPLLSEVGQRLSGYARAHSLDERHPIREVARLLREPKEHWRDRLDALRSDILGEVPLALLLDNFEDNLVEGTVADEGLAALLALWAASPGRSRLVLTCCYPFVLPDEAQLSLVFVHLGPLSFAETRKLILRLPGLKALTTTDQRRVYEAVGGHPRALEYLDALLSGGKAHFPDVQRRLNAALAKQGVKDPFRWCADTAGELDAKLAETVTLASADVLLDDLLARVATQPLAKRLLLGASVYRVPVDETGLAWMVAMPAERPADPERQARIDRVHQVWTEAQQGGEPFGLSPADIEQYQRDIQQHLRPPIEVPEAFSDVCRLLGDLTLLSPVRYAEDEPQRFLVHRWTAGVLQQRASEAERRAAHRAAAAYWRWRQDKLPQSREQDIEDLLEARFHYHAAGDRDEAVRVTEWISLQLHIWGAWEREQVLLMETLAWLPEQSAKAAAFQHQLGLVAQDRGELDEALDRYRQALAIFEQLDDRAGLARSYHQLGMVAQARGELGKTLEWTRQALAISEQLGDRAGLARSYHQLGLVAQDRGDLDDALRWYHQALAISEQLGDRASLARSYHQLGMVAQACGELGKTLEWTRQALAIFEQLGDRAGMALSYHQLGMVAQVRGELDDALRWYHQALAIFEQLGDRAGIARTLSQIGALHTEEGGDPTTGLSFNVRSFALRRQSGLAEIRFDVYWLTRQREMLGQDRFRTLLIEHLGEEGAATVEQWLQQRPSSKPSGES